MPKWDGIFHSKCQLNYIILILKSLYNSYTNYYYYYYYLILNLNLIYQIIVLKFI